MQRIVWFHQKLQFFVLTLFLYFAGGEDIKNKNKKKLKIIFSSGNEVDIVFQECIAHTKAYRSLIQL